MGGRDPATCALQRDWMAETRVKCRLSVNSCLEQRAAKDGLFVGRRKDGGGECQLELNGRIFQP